MSWRDYWNADNPIYVSERHQRLHYAGVADDLVALIRELCPRPATATVLDFGCGRAFDAARIAQACGRLVLADSAPRVLEDLRRQFGDDARIEIRSATDVTTRDGARFDLIVVNSVIQYLSRDELQQLLKTLHDLLAPQGRLVIADVIPRNTSAWMDASALLAFAARGRFLVAAVFGLVRTVFSDYRRLRSRLGIAHYDEADLAPLFAAAGLQARRRARNIGHNPWRATFVATARD